MGLKSVAAGVDGLCRGLGKGVAWLTLALVLGTAMVVLLRYAFDTGWIWMQELMTYLHAAIFMLGAAWALARDEHVRVDIFYRRRGPAFRRRVNVLGTWLLLVPVCVFILWISLDYVMASWQLLEGSREAGGLPLVYLLKTLIPLLALLLLAQGLALLARSPAGEEAGPRAPEAKSESG